MVAEAGVEETEHGLVPQPVGSREHADSPDWGGYPVDEVALRHEAGVEQETDDPREAYSRVPHRKPVHYADGWLPDLT